MEKGRGSYEENRDRHIVQSNGVNRTMKMNGTSSSEDLWSISLCSGVGYIEHPVSKFDTLAGIAIKYGVEVSDIKKMNALVTDQQMFALKSLQIPTPGKHPSPLLSEDLDISRKSNCEQDSTRLTSFDLLDSFQSLRIKSSTLKTPKQPHQAIVPGICELTSYGKGEFDHLGSHPKLASSHNPHGRRHRKSRSFANGFSLENIEFTDIVTAPNGATDSIKGGEKLCRRRQKSMADFSTATESISNKTYATNNGECLSMTKRSLDLRLKGALGRTNAASNGVTELSKLTPNLTDDVGGNSSFMSNRILGGRRSSSTCNLQEADKGNSSSSSMWSTSWSLKTDLQAFSSAMVTKSIFEGLPRSGSTRYKASRD
ncbi:Peptidoglycan-binding LysM domain-containing protein, putative isoform 1 [Cucumis melo var. makuwa]|uniref:LysM domain-containing protein n=2 Tax=Cucumis melo TaxID=3656 RepID=A0A9I9DTP6_CUCME|nr:Peptidoglycan-binding LysM domain-containing protein, putative isoform 1 [Cucumis melo var. makuwa]TYK10375.1 Peptidoglycan-binding LysM domain-containing protein, putative isoform 1 [Cucumis melo var. makuwa]